MSKAGFKQEQEKGYDATHRASFSVTHHTHGCPKEFRHFRGGRCARAFGSVLKTRAFAPFRERAHGALREARP